MLLRRLRSGLARLGIGLGLSAFALLLASCSSGSSGRAASSAVVRVTERDFRITLAPARVQAGTVRLLIRNQGPETHELLVVRSLRRRLPLRTDGLTVDEEVLARAMAGTLEGKGPGTSHELLLHLKPGRYELFCNMAGHYLGGMHAELVVT